MIIIPGLGALTITNATTSEIMFMPYMKHNDGRLAKFISEKEGMSELDAANLIAKYVREIEAKINVGDSYDMFQFGSFSKNTSGDIEFTQWKGSERTEEVETQFSEPDLDAMTVVADEKKDQLEIPAETEQETKEEEKEEVVTVEHDDKADLSAPIIVEEATVTEYVPEETKAETKVSPTKLTPLYTEEEQWEDDLDLPPINAKIERPKKPILEKAAKDKKSKSPVFYILLVAGVLVIGGTLTFAIFYNSLEKVITPKHHKEITSTENKKNEEQSQASEETSTDEANISETEEQAILETTEESAPPIQVNSTGSYHIIGGAFTDKSNADRYQARLAGEGNSSAIVGQFDGLYMVSISSYSTQEEADAALTNARGISSKAWIFRWP